MFHYFEVKSNLTFRHLETTLIDANDWRSLGFLMSLLNGDIGLVHLNPNPDPELFVHQPTNQNNWEPLD